MLRPQDVGHRVVVRKIIGVGGDRPLYTDLLGLLAELTETELTVLTRNGPRRVALADVHRSKLVPPTASPAARRAADRESAAVAELERAANQTWAAPVQQRLGDWLLRAADGWTGRANSALPLGDPGSPLPAAVDAVTAWYAERGLPAQVNVPLPAAAEVASELAGRGWRSGPLVLVQTVLLADLLADGADDPPGDAATVRLDRAPSPEWLALVSARKSAGDPLPAAAHRLLTDAPQVRFAHLYVDGRLVAIARGAVDADHRWCQIALLEVQPAARRRGHATRVLRAVGRWAVDELAVPAAFLQVEQHNPATALYARLGFTTHHVYLPWQPAVSDGPPDGAC
ncbi:MULTISPECIES: GNAT family N-acetyltransferase [unclassified Solwaraspora]|uniref:GNAT family N-acetyltransferase n=1 Tax=unclassified Solwaraspora TaxID=2627926 RepID=UPI00248CEDE2|nr:MULTISPECIES: GNAT family N-acetyltransferase [unclassified Solwaraspora]WBB97960.1 GNAT family N-acetyltransferase [Solwaraspora sp. WMMA2059]WBC23481.1 GNAT family N-acetyltransferase [Solwaraspora sp. WMMA2080]WJK34434.1 GNAT family N-acetyltransferase [Solwaraspora sp. WMMA2065]